MSSRDLDIKSENILTYLDEEKVLPAYLENRVVAELLASRSPGDPYSPIVTTQMCAPDDMSNLKIRLGDFGEVKHVEEQFFKLIQPHLLRAPEVILLAGWDTKVDIWNLACVVSERYRAELFKFWTLMFTYKVWEIFERRRLFGGKIKAKDPYTFEGHLRHIVHQLGPAPQQYRDLEAGKYLFDDSGMFGSRHISSTSILLTYAA